MDVAKLVTLTFDKNVGPRDRVFRLLSGGALIVSGWALSAPFAVSVALSVLGAMWTLTGILSRCTIYYLLGHSTCRVSE